jgi:DNA polymerase V
LNRFFGTPATAIARRQVFKRIWPGDILIVDRSLKPTHARLVAVQVHGEVIIRRLMIRDRQGWLKPENPAYATIELKEGLDYRILGVVRHQIHTV